MSTILLLNGPNLNLLGHRETDFYGSQELAVIEQNCTSLASELGHRLETLQSNAEHEMISRVHAAADEGVECIIINPAAWTHTSIALRDALLAVNIPFIEIHLSNPAARESFRRRSFFSDIALGSIVGLGTVVYELAVRAAAAYLNED